MTKKKAKVPVLRPAKKAAKKKAAKKPKKAGPAQGRVRPHIPPAVMAAAAHLGSGAAVVAAAKLGGDLYEGAKKLIGKAIDRIIGAKKKRPKKTPRKKATRKTQVR